MGQQGSSSTLTTTHYSFESMQAMLGALPLLAATAAAALLVVLLSASTTDAFKLPLRMVGDSRPGQQVGGSVLCVSVNGRRKEGGGRVDWIGMARLD